MPIALLLAEPAALGGILGFLPIVFIFVIFYFLLIVPTQRRQKKIQQMLAALKTGDKVVTTGGIRGTIISLKEDTVQLRVPPDNVKLEILRSAVAQRLEEQQEK